MNGVQIVSVVNSKPVPTWGIYYLTELVLHFPLSPEPYYLFCCSWTGGGQEELMWVIFSSFLWTLEQRFIKARRQFWNGVFQGYTLTWEENMHHFSECEIIASIKRTFNPWTWVSKALQLKSIDRKLPLPPSRDGQKRVLKRLLSFFFIWFKDTSDEHFKMDSILEYIAKFLLVCIPLSSCAPRVPNVLAYAGCEYQNTQNSQLKIAKNGKTVRHTTSTLSRNVARLFLLTRKSPGRPY